MKKSLPVTALTLLIALATLPGCPSQQSSVPKANVNKKSTRDSWRMGLDLLRQATDSARYWEGLKLLNDGIQQKPEFRSQVAVAAEPRKFLEATVGLTADELQEVESANFRPADAHHVAESFLLRDSARSLEVHGLAPDELARHCFRWVDRHVRLHQQGEDWAPPAQVLERGYGGGRDRALVFLALMRQLQLEGCLFLRPGSPDEVVLFGLLSKDGKNVWLFDPRLGLEVRTAGGKVATLADVQADPKVLEPSGLSAEELKAVEVRIACPLYALSPRMRELEKALSAQDRIVLYLDPVRLQSDVAKATGRPVQVWNSRAADGGVENSPTRALRMILPPDEGGTDKEDRLKRFQADLVPWASIGLAFEEIRLGREQLGDKAFAQLLRIAGELFEKYDLQPHQTLLRGRDVIQRLDRVRGFLEDESLISQTDDPAFQKAVAAWRSDANKAYAALEGNQPSGKALVNTLWGEDQYLLTLLQADAEERPDRYKKMALTRIIAHAVRGPLSQRVLWLRAMVWQEKAERDQQIAAAATKNKSAAANAHNAWLNTRVAWNQYLDRATPGDAARAQRLEAIRAQAKRGGPGPAYAASLLEEMHRDLHRDAAARIEHARATYFLDGAKVAVPPLRQLADQLDALREKGKDGTAAMAAVVAEVRQRLHGPKAAVSVRSLDLMDRDWTPQGNVYWVGQQIRVQIARWAEKGGS
jgi:hypothetical protein